MTKQEEIREGLKDILFPDQEDIEGEWGMGDKDEATLKSYIRADEILRYLDMKGVVIKVKRELPVKIEGQENMHYCAGYYNACQRMIESGYIATESLIEEKHGNKST